jgi:geranylgeranyl diphosphate synthase type II
LETHKMLVDQTLRKLISELESKYKINPVLMEAVEYSLFPGGKRIRPILCINAFETIGGTGDKILPYAAALELGHTSSLIKDDLPAMDNHRERRGNPSCWKKFGVATAMMAADLLSFEAFRISLSYPDKRVTIELMDSIISMINGQTLDCLGVRSPQINELKTAKLFEACFVIGAIIGGATEDQIEVFRQQGNKYGIEFQLRDDIQDGDGLSEISRRSSMAQ